MQSKNVLWLGLLFVLLLTAFCIAKYIDQFHPSIQTINNPKKEIVDQNFELKPVHITEITQESKVTEEKLEVEEVDTDYLQIIKLVEQEEKDIQDAYNKALEEENKRNLQQTEKKPIKKIAKKHIPKKQSITKSYPPIQADNKVLLEMILANQTISSSGALSEYEKKQLRYLAINLEQNPTSYLKIEADNNYEKINLIKRYLKKFGISLDAINIIKKESKSAILISHTNHNDIEISIIKKD